MVSRVGLGRNGGKKRAAVVIVVALTAAAAVFAAMLAGRASSASAAALAGPSCTAATIGVTGPFTGPAASAGLDQRNWARLFMSYWNAGKPIPGVPASLKRVKLKSVEDDTQLNAQVAATVAVQLRSNAAVLAVVGFSGSQENVAGGPILRRGGLGFVSGSATRASLTDPTTPDGSVLATGYFHRVVPNDNFQSATDAKWVEKTVKKGGTVMAVDQAEAYSVPLVNAIETMLKAAGITVDHESQPADNTDFTSLAQKAVAEHAAYVILASQVASNAQLFAQQLKADGYTGKFLGTDGTFDSSKFNVEGAYITYFGPDVHYIAADKALVADFKSKYGDTNSFGAPTWVATQVIATAISQACADGKVSRGEVRKDLANVSLSTSLLGRPIKFTKNGDISGGSFPVYQIQGGKYVQVQS
jgi:ABC-type branched-subunit amino acid transport system substrate-binding protein